MLRRLALLYSGLVLYGLSSAMMVCAGLGLDPWNALHEGLSLRLHVSFGTVIIGVGALLMLLWIPPPPTTGYRDDQQCAPHRPRR